MYGGVTVNKLHKSGHNANPHLLLHPLRIAFTMNIIIKARTLLDAKAHVAKN